MEAKIVGSVVFILVNILHQNVANPLPAANPQPSSIVSRTASLPHLSSPNHSIVGTYAPSSVHHSTLSTNSLSRNSLFDGGSLASGTHSIRTSVNDPSDSANNIGRHSLVESPPHIDPIDSASNIGRHSSVESLPHIEPRHSASNINNDRGIYSNGGHFGINDILMSLAASAQIAAGSTSAVANGFMISQGQELTKAGVEAHETQAKANRLLAEANSLDLKEREASIRIVYGNLQSDIENLKKRNAEIDILLQTASDSLKLVYISQRIGNNNRIADLSRTLEVYKDKFKGILTD